MKRACENDTNRDDMWDKEQLLKSVYEPGNTNPMNRVVVHQQDRIT